MLMLPWTQGHVTHHRWKHTLTLDVLNAALNSTNSTETSQHGRTRTHQQVLITWSHLRSGSMADNDTYIATNVFIIRIIKEYWSPQQITTSCLLTSFKPNNTSPHVFDILQLNLVSETESEETGELMLTLSTDFTASWTGKNQLVQWDQEPTDNIRTQYLTAEHSRARFNMFLKHQ